MLTQEEDQQLVERVQRGDKRAFDLLVLKYQHKILGLIVRFVHDTHEAQDVAQEAFVAAWPAGEVTQFRNAVAPATLIETFALPANFAGLITYPWNELTSSVEPPRAAASLSRVSTLSVVTPCVRITSPS